MSADDFNVIETETGQEKVNYMVVLMTQMMRINDIASRLNDTAPELHRINYEMEKSANGLSEDALKPNRINFITAVRIFRSTFYPYLKGNIKDEIETLDKKDINEVEKTFQIYEKILFGLYAKGLLPIESMDYN